MHTKDHACLCCPWKCMEQCILKAISLQCLSTLNPLIQHTHTHSTPVACGSTVRFQHLNTRLFLHSHHFRSPLSGNQEVSCFGDGYEGDEGGDRVGRYGGGRRWFEKEGGSFSKLLFFPQKVCISLIQEGSSCVYSTCCLSWPLIAPVVHGVMWLIRTIHDLPHSSFQNFNAIA